MRAANSGFRGCFERGVSQADIMRHRTSQKLYDYWNHVRGDRSAPNRFDIEPSKIADILPSTFILERAGADTYQFRLAGTRMCEIFGKELRCTNFLAGWPLEDRHLLVRNLSVLTNQAATALIHFQATARAEQAIEFEVLLLPLFHTHKKIDRILGCCSPLGSPSWLGDKPLLSRRLVANELVWPNSDRQASIPAKSSASTIETQDGSARIVRSAERRFIVFEGGLGRAADKEI